MLSKPIEALVAAFAKLPGVGERTALRHVLYLLTENRTAITDLAASLLEVGEKVKECDLCHNLTADDEDTCRICRSNVRDHATLCVVASVQDLIAIEMTQTFNGRYHILHGLLAPIKGIGPDELRIEALSNRLRAGHEIKEVIVATPPTLEGEATALYLAEVLVAFGVNVSRIASGVPVGGDLQYADRLSLSQA